LGFGFAVLQVEDRLHSQLEQLRILKEHELGVRIEHAEGGHGPYVPKDSTEEE
jgi:hypothetical protein